MQKSLLTILIISILCIDINYIKRNGFVVLTKRMIRQLTEDILAYAKLKLDKSVISEISILDLGCGLGSFASALREMGVKVIPIDNKSRDGFNFTFDAWIDDIIEMDMIDAIHKYGNDVDFIVLSWPDYNSPNA